MDFMHGITQKKCSEDRLDSDAGIFLMVKLHLYWNIWENEVMLKFWLIIDDYEYI